MNLWRYLQKIHYSQQTKRDDKNWNAQWFIRFGWQDNIFSRGLDRLFEIIPPADRLYADPFIATKNGRYFIFFEEYILNGPVGFISVIEVFTDGSYGEATPIIRCPYHLSYPWLFQQSGQWFMLPESHQNKTIELWACTNFPYQWQKSTTLMENVIAADTTPFFYENRWWLFTALKQNCKKFGDKLFLFYGDDLFGQNWTAHPQNPVRHSLVYDRPAGNLFWHEGRLLRPAQDSLKCYGGAMELREVTTLNPTQYHEQTYQRIEPNWNDSVLGTHTLNQYQGLVVMDALHHVPK